MEVFTEYLAQIRDETQRTRVKEVLDWVRHDFPELQPRYAWNQPMFTDHGTFIIGFSIAKLHMAVSPERAGMEHFHDDISEAGYSQSTMLFRIKWDEPVNYELLGRIIRFNQTDKAECRTFWRK
ncbi:iron chaperone [Anaerolentibacter hominis]|uniref:iron chaperone n=1 Tax=Anaerolentibacter hominis TaxID=3079009 RepID=UPI0031B81270